VYSLVLLEKSNSNLNFPSTSVTTPEFLPFTINELENLFFKKYKKLLPTYLILNDPKNL
jgi:hypothetical protein